MFIKEINNFSLNTNDNKTTKSIDYIELLYNAQKKKLSNYVIIILFRKLKIKTIHGEGIKILTLKQIL